jgi:hypothetical protein
MNAAFAKLVESFRPPGDDSDSAHRSTLRPVLEGIQQKGSGTIQMLDHTVEHMCRKNIHD